MVRYDLYRFFLDPAHAVSMANVETIKDLNIAIEQEYEKVSYNRLHPEKMTLAHFDDHNPIVLAEASGFVLKVVRKVK